MLKLVFWILLFILFYTYLGYALVVFLIVQIKKIFSPGENQYDPGYEPEVCLFITAYNEKDYIREKVKNTLALDYPKTKIQYVWVTDGSDDGTPDLLRQYPRLEVYHLSARRGKMHAMNRGMKFVKAPLVIFSDTNSLLNEKAIREICQKFSDPRVGCVAGEKRICRHAAEDAAGAGEGLYWKLESFVKRMDAEMNTAVGAVGELFAIRSELFEEVETDTILDDFVISLRIAQKGYKIAYTPNAWGEETASQNVREELKRKIRIAAGGMQALFRLRSLLNPFKNGLLTWQYVSHKVLRWTLAPVALFLLFFLNLGIVASEHSWTAPAFFALFFWFQVLCYLLAGVGWFFENRKLRFKILFVPYYFLSINYASVRGIFRYLRRKQPAGWEKSKRAAPV